MRPKEVVNKWVAAFNKADVDALIALYHEDAENYQLTNEPVVGIKAMEAIFKKKFETAEVVIIIENIFEDGQWAILKWKDQLNLHGCSFFHIVNGKIQYQEEYGGKANLLIQPNIDNKDLYYKSLTHRYICALIELDGESRQRALDISQELYNDKEKAKVWRDDIVKHIHPDCCKIEGAENAMSKLNELYRRMVSNE